MNLNDTYFVSFKTDMTTIESNLITGETKSYTSSDAVYNHLKDIIKISKAHNFNDETRRQAILGKLGLLGITGEEALKRLPNNLTSVTPSKLEPSATAATKALKELATKTTQKIINFFTEFNFTPSLRFINSLAISPDPTKYCINYFAVQDHPYAAEIKEKVKSAEFKEIALNLKKFKPAPINKHFELYYGEPGTGKTTKAQSLGSKTIVCRSDMLPQDLLRNFVFNEDGKAAFDPSDLYKAMESGDTIVLDEVNMLPFESLRFLQGITDNKDSIDQDGHHINIHPDFKIYATMNLHVNGQCIPLPAPLVDRAYDIVEFELKAEELAAISLLGETI